MLQRDGYITTDDAVRLYFRSVGTGAKPVIIPNGIYLLDDFAPLADSRTFIAFDVRSRGRSDHVSDLSKIERGVLHDVDDLDAVRRQFNLARVDLLGHSYVGLTVILYALRFPDHVNRVVQIGPIQRDSRTEYPAHLMNADQTLRDVLSRVAELDKERSSTDPTEFCRKIWSVLRVLYVADPADAHRIRWGRCDLPNELNGLKHWTEILFPSIQRVRLTPEEIRKVTAPVLTVHGTKDRSSPYGGGREWASMLPDARLVTVEGAAHAPWIEAPETVFGSIATFLDGSWPPAAQKVESVV